MTADEFAPRLTAWQEAQGRHHLPWQQGSGDRDTRDPYRVWLSEIMLQQTQVAAVIPYYERFVARFPDVRALAAASLDDVMQHWSGLGYYSRARNLHAAARRVVEVHDGVFPDTPEALAELPGIGRSTAAAIAAFAFGRCAAILDGNVQRVLARVFAIDGTTSNAATSRRLWDLAQSLLPSRSIESYTQGLMDLGATVCRPRNPTCMLCPFANDCRARIEGRIDELPQRRSRKAVPERRATMLFVTHGAQCDYVLLERRPPLGIWGGLWSLPESPAEEDPRIRIERHGLVASIESAGGFTHGFTHFTLHADVLHARVERRAAPTDAQDAVDSVRWLDAGDALALGLPAPVRKWMAARFASR